MFRKITLLTALALGLAACESSTPYGECVGVQDLSEARRQHPQLQYKLSTQNTILGIVFFQTLFAPAIWLFADFECPVGKQ